MRFIIINDLAVKVDDIKSIMVQRDDEASDHLEHYLDIIFTFYDGSDWAQKLAHQGASLIQEVKYNGALPEDFETEKFFIRRLVQQVNKNGIFDIEELVDKIGLDINSAKSYIDNITNN